MIELYVLDSCPYSQKVMKYLDENNIEYIKHDVSEPENYEALEEIGGKLQVPFMFDKDKELKLYESDDIIEYLKNNL